MHRIKENIKKHETHEITSPSDDDAGEPRSAKVIDLAALLKQSIDGGGSRHAARRPKAGKPDLRVVESPRAKPVARRKRA
jgi:DNA end-binding protein Ku